jgi:hypothetical protein
MLELISVVKTGPNWYLRKILVNPDHITVVQEAPEMPKVLEEGTRQLGLSEHVSFCRISMDSISGLKEIIAIGTPSDLLRKINSNTKRVLKG